MFNTQKKQHTAFVQRDSKQHIMFQQGFNVWFILLCWNISAIENFVTKRDHQVLRRESEQRITSGGSAAEWNLRVVFKHLGTTQSTQGYAHLHLELDLAPAIDQVNSAISAAQILKNFVEEERKATNSATSKRALKKQLKRIAVYGHRLEDAQHKLFDYISLSSHTQIREKRQLVALLGWIGSITGIFSAVTVAALAGTVSGIRTDTNFLIYTAKDHESRISTNSKDIFLLRDLTEDLFEDLNELQLQVNTLALMASFNDVTTQCEKMVENIDKIISEAFINRLSVRAIPADQVDKLVHNLKKEAARRGFVLDIKALADIFQAETSFVANRTKFHLFTHIPLARANGLLDIYQYIPFPMEVQESTLAVTIKADKQIIAVHREDPSRGFIEMTTADLQACRQVGSRYWCENNNVVTKNNSRSCTAALFFKEFNKVKTNCDLFFDDKQDTIVQTGSHSFLSMAATNNFITITCQGKSGQTELPNKGTTSFNISEGCIAESASHRFAPSLDLQSDVANIIHFEIPLPIEELQGQISTEELEAAKVKWQAIGNKAPSLHNLARDIVKYREQHSSWSIFKIMAVSATIAAILIGGGLIIRWCWAHNIRTNQAKANAQPKASAPPAYLQHQGLTQVTEKPRTDLFNY